MNYAKIMGRPTLGALGIEVYSSLCICAHARNISVCIVDTPDFKGCRRINIIVETLQQPGGREEAVDPLTERLVLRGPEMSMVSEQELGERDVALEPAVLATRSNGMSESGVSQLRELVKCHADAFQSALGGDLPARVEPAKLKFKPGAGTFKARPWAYSPVKAVWLARSLVILVGLELMYRELQAMWASAASETPQKGGLRMVSAFRAMNRQMEEVPSVMRNHEAEMIDLLGTAFFWQAGYDARVLVNGVGV